MSSPSLKEARRFYHVAYQRYEDAQILFGNGRYTGAFYLAGYAIECILKALLLQNTPKRDREEVLESFRGSKAHDFEWLRHQLRQKSLTIPAEIGRRLSSVGTWVDERYNPGRKPHAGTWAFLASAKAVLDWADGRI
jgi:HEPN domain-containing protein